jgi:hypothetical protein
MNRSQVQRGIIKTWETAESLGIAESFSQSTPLPIHNEFRDLILSGHASYRDVYTSALSWSYYNVLLNDYSFFQFSLDRDSYVRYAYYPNPFLSGTPQDLAAFKQRRELVEAGMLTHEDFLRLISDSSHFSGVPMLRYENAPDQRVRFHHPCSHLHIGFHAENRWPLRRTLTPYAFSLLIYKNYYGSHWRTFDDEVNDDIRNSLDRELISEKSLCALVREDLFDPIEERSFFFS